MGAAEARALWQRTASRCFAVHEDAKMAPRLACCQHQHSSSGNTEKNSFSSGSFGDSSDFSCDTKWWLKGSTGFDEEITNSFLEDTKCKKLQEFVDLIGIQEEKEDYSFIGSKATPWWRSTTDKEELALLVASKSSDHNIQNCDLPPPQKLHKSIHCTSGEKGFKTAVRSPWKQGVCSERFEKSLSYNSSTESKNTSPMSSPRSDDLSKSQLLEALRHSQTRAREAEKAAREACAEKDRVIEILLRQASQMLAYKHWLKLLEMEALYLQMKKEGEVEEQIKGMNLKKRKQRREKKKKGEIGRYMMAFAVGFSLIGAGLLLGWTVGWFFTL
ncbi:hypothetical protein CARUB_v10009708mg [Capsella rubella]|uniref:Uncharacterized protein n=2 Tax=Capsella rubella TaxID=81985 RepID=R0GQL8_9BRAS|nr:uncharacterized protein LOC17896982 isoform X2 [Capsella rubella]XP_023645243.1 uncharacterized protein LOC17896982 isoform X2 [Capsella rubella]EOA38227.1 hypothetical protein CARUB_v10009708mg [Capsella rubella]EOA38228.1 hypothetical protein CARUB_v10009708mg [Capsella rubella]